MNIEDLEAKFPDLVKEGMKLPANHANISKGNIDQCPYVQIQKELQKNKKDGETKVKKPKGGCPVMPSTKKKNPGLECYPRTYEIPYISPMKFILNFTGFLETEEKQAAKRVKFDSYPTYLHHSIFHDDESMVKVRKLELCQRFFILDDWREKGNKCLNKGELTEAIKCYERGLACLKWLEYKPTPITPSESVTTQDSTESVKGESTILTDKKNDDAVVKPEEAKEAAKKNKYSLIAAYTDENVTLFDGEDITEVHDTDMRNSSLMQLYLNLAVAYIKLNHFEMAGKALEDARKIAPEASQVYYRRSQIISMNKMSTIEELEQAKADAEHAIELKKTEKMMRSEPGILKILNLQNVDEAYVQQRKFAEDAIRERIAYEKTHIQELFERAKSIENFEKKREAEGKPPRDDELSALEMDENEMMDEYEIAQLINEKYDRVIEYYQENTNSNAVTQARKELLNAKDLYQELTFVKNLNFKEYRTNPIMVDLQQDAEYALNLDDRKIQLRLQRLKRDYIRQLYDSRSKTYNFQVFKWALDEHFKKKAADEREKERKLKRHSQGDSKVGKPLLSRIFTLEFSLQVAVILLLFFGFYIMNRNSGLINKYLFKQ